MCSLATLETKNHENSRLREGAERSGAPSLNLYIASRARPKAWISSEFNSLSNALGPMSIRCVLSEISKKVCPRVEPWTWVPQCGTQALKGLSRELFFFRNCSRGSYLVPSDSGNQKNVLPKSVINPFYAGGDLRIQPFQAGRGGGVVLRVISDF